jgi:hypothetical protein
MYDMAIEIQKHYSKQDGIFSYIYVTCSIKWRKKPGYASQSEVPWGVKIEVEVAHRKNFSQMDCVLHLPD